MVQCSMVRMMLTLTMKLGLRMKQVDYSKAFVQADINGDVYCELPTEILPADGGKPDYVLKLKKSLYRLYQAPLLWFKTLEKSLLNRGLRLAGRTMYVHEDGTCCPCVCGWCIIFRGDRCNNRRDDCESEEGFLFEGGI